MKILKHILLFIIEPFRYIFNKNFGEKAVAKFQAYPFLTYVLATILTIVVLFFIFVFPTLV